MLKDITIGQYYPGKSFVHKIDPRVKLIIGLFYMVSLFFIDSFILYGIAIVGVLLTIMASGIPLKVFLKGLKPLRFILAITFIINVLFTKGETMFSIGPIAVSYQGLYLACRMAIRLIMLIIGTSILTLTTTPIALTDGMEGLLSPLKKIGFPAHELAMVMTIALRFVPTLIEETDKIMKAQMARGADFESGNIMNRAKSLVPLLVPLFINSFRRAADLATAMEARCYHGGEGRTRLNELKLTGKDIAVLIGVVVFFGILIYANNAFELV
ncbi:MAG: energy-coupling factor transporter transmembrane protein EcfT [Tissierellia bacterium]|nr:energy-coupling factor transporter transmembrane protein EcfT [Tissierellia bacterium]